MKFPDAVEADLEGLILSGNGRTPAASAMPLDGDQGLYEDYLAGLRGAVFEGAKLGEMKIVLDCANGAASKLAPELFRSLGTTVIAMNDRPNGRNINSACGSLYPQGLQERVVEAGLDLGVAFDGDGVLLAAGHHMKSSGRLRGDVIVGTTMTNLGLEHALAKSGLKLARTAVGDRYVLEEMQRIAANLGGEPSGHVLFLDDA